MVMIGIDYGDRRIGVAKSDPLGILAGGLDTIVRKDNHPFSHIEAILGLVRQYGAKKIVIGMPRNMDGSYGPRAEHTRSFAQALQEHTDVEIVLWDERLTTRAAHRTMHEREMRTGHHKKDVDRIAACHLLQSYLNSIKGGNT